MKVLILCLILVIPGFALAADLEEGNRAFAAGKFADSTAAYQAVLKTSGYSAPVLYDLGNSLVREGRLPEAILAYEQARWLAPGDADILANLQAAEKESGVPLTQPSAISRLVEILSANSWAWLASLAWAVLCGCLLLRALLPRQRLLLASGAVACAVCLCLAVGGVLLSSAPLRTAVVLDKNASALISPFAGAQLQFTPEAGETVTIAQAHHDYLFIMDRAGKSGWVAKDQIAPVLPP